MENATRKKCAGGTTSFFTILYADEPCVLLFAGKKYLFDRGDLMLCRENTSWISTAPIYSVDYQSSYLDPLFYSQISDCRIIYDFLSIAEPKEEHLFFHSSGDSEIASLFRFLLQDLSQNDPYTDKNIRLFTVALVTYLDRKRPQQLLLQNSTMVAENRFGKIMKYIGDHYPTCTLQEVAETFGYNPSYLSTRFQKITGETFSHKLQSIRLLQAERLLLTTDLTVEQISSQIGF
ncbi:MAG: helix-turn-helix transcriptional regulator, partial [Bulleidia sp.]